MHFVLFTHAGPESSNRSCCHYCLLGSNYLVVHTTPSGETFLHCWDLRGVSVAFFFVAVFRNHAFMFVASPVLHFHMAFYTSTQKRQKTLLEDLGWMGIRDEDVEEMDRRRIEMKDGYAVMTMSVGQSLGRRG